MFEKKSNNNSPEEDLGVFKPAKGTSKVIIGQGVKIKGEILNADWRSGDSIWSLVSEKNLSKVIKKISELLKKNELEAYVHNNDKNRHLSGQITFTIARKT